MEVVLTRGEGKKEPKTTSIEARNLFAFNATFSFTIMSAMQPFPGPEKPLNWTS